MRRICWSDTGLDIAPRGIHDGKVTRQIFEDNTKAWSATIASIHAIPGVLFSSHKFIEDNPRSWMWRRRS